MIKLENLHLGPIEPVIRGMRNPMNSWDKSDTKSTKLRFMSILKRKSKKSSAWTSTPNTRPPTLIARLRRAIFGTQTSIGPNDLDLMTRLADAGPVHAKYRRMMTVFIDITAPLYWWKEFDTYKVGTVANSCSTMHKIQEKEFTMEDFSTEHLFDFTPYAPDNVLPIAVFSDTIKALNYWRNEYLAALKAKDAAKTPAKDIWWQMIQLLPSSYNQKRTVMLNYEVLANIYKYRKEHKLDEWREFCKWIETLPYSELITGVKTA